MAFSSAGTVASMASGGTAGTALTSTAVSVPAGAFLVVMPAVDNVGTTDADGSEISAVTDQAGNIYTKIGEFRNGQAAAGAGVTAALWACLLTTPLSSQTLTVTFANSLTHSCVQVWRFNVAAGSAVTQAGTTQTNAVDAASAMGSLTVGSLTSKEYLFVRVVGRELNSVTNLTLTTNFVALTAVRSQNIAAAISFGGEYRIVTATSQASAPSTTACDGVSVYAAFQEVPDVVEALAVTRTMGAGLGIAPQP